AGPRRPYRHAADADGERGARLLLPDTTAGWVARPERSEGRGERRRLFITPVASLRACHPRSAASARLPGNRCCSHAQRPHRRRAAGGGSCPPYVRRARLATGRLASFVALAILTLVGRPARVIAYGAVVLVGQSRNPRRLLPRLLLAPQYRARPRRLRR